MAITIKQSLLKSLFAILRRLLKGENIGVADKEHFHHQLLKMKYSPMKSIIIIYLINIAFASVSIFYVLGDTQIAIAIYIILMILLLFVVLNTDILFDHSKKKTEVNKINDKKKRKVKKK